MMNSSSKILMMNYTEENLEFLKMTIILNRILPQKKGLLTMLAIPSEIIIIIQLSRNYLPVGANLLSSIAALSS